MGVVIVIAAALALGVILLALVPRLSRPKGLFDTKRARGTALGIVVGVVFVTVTVTDAIATRKLEPKVERATRELRQGLDALNLDEPLAFRPDALPRPAETRQRTASIGRDEVRVNVEIGVWWKSKCLRGTKQRGRRAVVDVLDRGCGG